MRNGRRKIGLVSISALLLFLWQLGSTEGLLSALYFPSPLGILTSYRPQLGEGAVVTTARALCGYLAGLLIAYLAHFLCVGCKLDRYLDAQFTGARAVPVIAILPLFIIWFGFREIGRFLVVTLATTAFYIAPLHESYRLMPRQWTMLRQQLALRFPRYYMIVVVPGTLPALGAALRISLAISFTMAIASEYIGAQLGIGKFLDSARITFNVPAIFLALWLCSLVGIGLDRSLMWLYHRNVHWAGKQPKL
jgi:ABC-type nitrate/sulfonate/bicarbonate transport system permease component